MKKQTLLVVGGHSLNRDALEEGFRRCGWDIIPYDGGPIPETDAAMMRGLKGDKRAVRDEFVKRGKPVAVLECGWFKRASANSLGYSQLGQARIGWLPARECPPDRWTALGLPVIEREEILGGHYLLAGQVPNDAQHDLCPFDMQVIYRAMIAEALAGAARPPVIYRPHPMGTPDFEWPEIQDPMETPLAEALQSARGVITYNSTVGTECIRLGIPVYCSRDAMYYELSAGPELQFVAERREREAFFHRLAYAQWHTAELESGEAVRHWIAEAEEWERVMRFQRLARPVKKVKTA